MENRGGQFEAPCHFIWMLLVWLSRDANSMDHKINQLVSLEGRVAVISGAASGIGRGAAACLAEAGAAVALLYIDQAKGKEAETAMLAHGQRARFIRCDVRSDSDCRCAVDDGVDYVISFEPTLLRRAGSTPPG